MKACMERSSERIDAFVGEAEQFDDLTMLCLEYRGRDGAPRGAAGAPGSGQPDDEK